jgi:NAD dependent epimerase/dehydratase family enzyme
MAGGRQWISWLHIDDFLAIVRLALDDGSFSGTVHPPVPIR